MAGEAPRARFGVVVKAGAAVALLFLLLTSSPAVAGSLITSPGSIELEMLPGTSARAILSVENRLDRSCTLEFSPFLPKSFAAGHSGLPSMSWIELDTTRVRLAPGERAWVVAVVTVPDDEALRGRRWQVNIDVVCLEQPLLGGEHIILVSVGTAMRPGASAWVVAGIVAGSLLSAVAWNQWLNQRRSDWPTGLRVGHWRC